AAFSGKVKIIGIQLSCFYFKQVFLFFDLICEAGVADHQRDECPVQIPLLPPTVPGHAQEQKIKSQKGCEQNAAQPVFRSGQQSEIAKGDPNRSKQQAGCDQQPAVTQLVDEQSPVVVAGVPALRHVEKSNVQTQFAEGAKPVPENESGRILVGHLFDGLAQG